MGYEELNLIELAQDKIHLLAFVNMVVNLGLLYSRDFLNQLNYYQLAHI